MKVLPQKNSKTPKYPKLTSVDSVKTVAALTLTASTLFTVASCTDMKIGSGTFNKTNIKTTESPAIDGGIVEPDPTEDLGYAGGETCLDPVEYTVLIASGVEKNYEWINSNSCIDLKYGDTLCANGLFAIVYDTNLSDVEDDSEFYEMFPESKYAYYETLDGNLVIVSDDSNYTIDYAEIELAGDVAYIDEED